MIMYLSRVEIDRNNRQKIKDLTHLGAYHNWVEQSFPDELKQEIRTRKLWRVDRLDGKDYLLIVSSSTPDLKDLERYGVEGSAASKNYDRFLDSLRNGQVMRFRVVLNPVVAKLETPSSKRGRLLPLLSEADQLNFFMKRTHSNGFSVEANDVMLVETGFEVLKKSHQRAVRLKKASYEGKLTISDVEVFRNTLIKGMGRKKAYGFGMMTVIPGV